MRAEIAVNPPIQTPARVLAERIRALAPALVVLLACALQSIAIYNARTDFFTDDTGFFFRYARHIAMGEGYRWNLGEPPIWGASAPLWPALLAACVAVGISPESAAVGLGAALTLIATGLLADCLSRMASPLAGAAFAIFAACNYRFSAWGIQGMETPLTYLVVALCICAIAYRWSWVTIGVLSALAAIHKLDLVPLAGLLVVSHGFQAGWRSGLRSAGEAAVIVGIAAVAAWIHFGSLLPNSAVTKMEYTFHMATDWFWTQGLYSGSRMILLVLALLSIPWIVVRPALFGVCWCFVVVVLAAFSLKPPAEGYEWYLSSIQPMLLLLAAAGATSLLGVASSPERFRRPWAATLGFVAGISGIGLIMIHQDAPALRFHKLGIQKMEGDRVAAGRWIAANTPKDAVVLTGFGNVAYYCDRYVIDYSFLNRTPPIEPPYDMVARLKPDVVCFCNCGSPLPIDQYYPPPGYRIAAVFDSAARAGVAHFYAVVMLRNRETADR